MYIPRSFTLETRVLFSIYLFLELNASLQQNVDKYQNKVLELHSIIKTKDDSLLEAKKKLQDATTNRNMEKKNYEKNIDALQQQCHTLQKECQTSKEEIQHWKNESSNLKE